MHLNEKRFTSMLVVSIFSPRTAGGCMLMRTGQGRVLCQARSEGNSMGKTKARFALISFVFATQ